MDQDNRVKVPVSYPFPRHTSYQLELMFRQSLTGIFFMMLDEPVVWDETVDQERVLDYVFDHHRITEANQAMLDQYRTSLVDFIGTTPSQLFAHDLPYGRSVWRELFDQGHLHIDTDAKRLDGSRMAVLGDYICLYDDQGRITGHFGVQIDITERKMVEEALYFNEKRYNLALDGTNAGIWDWDLANDRVYFSPPFKKILGFEPDQMADSVAAWQERWHPDEAGKIKQAMSDFLEGRSKTYKMVHRLRHQDGMWRWILSRGGLLHDEAGKPSRWVGTITDLTELIEEREQHSALQQFFSISPDLMFIRDDQGVVKKANQAWLTILGYQREELERIHLPDLIHPEDRQAAQTVFKPSLDQKRESMTCRMQTKAGTYRSIEWYLQTVDGWLYATGRDVSEQLRNKEQLEILASRDQMTGLYNRNHFDNVISDLMEHSDRYNEPLACILFDLDHFKAVNDTFGHQTGDEVLKTIAWTVEKIMRQSDLAFRFGGEEFLVLMPHTAIGGAAIAAEKLRAAIEATDFPKVGRQTISIGVSERMRAESLRHWLRRTDDALYRAKQSGRNQVVDAAGFDRTTLASAQLDWQQEWNSGHAQIDSQHQELVRIANQLLHLYLANAGPQSMQNQLELMFQHVIVHFETEEKILAAAGYPELGSHARVHEKLVTKLNRLYQDYQNGEIKPSAFFSFVIDDVLLEHLAKVDMLFFDWTTPKE